MSKWREVTIGDCRLIQADCREVLPVACDAIVTDPPFGVRDDDWDAMNSQQFARFTMGWMALADAPEVFTFGTCGSVIESLLKLLYPSVRQMIWHKPLGSQYNGAHAARRFYAFEPIFHGFTKETWEVVKPKTMVVANMIREGRERAGLSRGAVDMIVRGKKTGLCYRWEEAACLPTPQQVEQIAAPLGLNGDFHAALEVAYTDRDDTLEQAAEQAARATDVLTYRTVTRGTHPCEKPVELLADVLSTTDARTICDPFMGVGSTGVACARSNRAFIGVEQDTDYFDIAVKRIEKAYADQALFAGAK